MPAPVASGWSDRRVGLAPTGKAPPCHGAHGNRSLDYQLSEHDSEIQTISHTIRTCSLSSAPSMSLKEDVRHPNRASAAERRETGGRHETFRSRTSHPTDLHPFDRGTEVVRSRSELVLRLQP